MSTYTPKPGSFSLFKSDRKEKDTHPDYAGSGVLPDGSEAWINAWLKETRDGKKFFSIAIKPKEQRREEADSFRGERDGRLSGGGSPADRAGSFSADLDDEIPF